MSERSTVGRDIHLTFVSIIEKPPMKKKKEKEKSMHYDPLLSESQPTVSIA